MANSPSLRENLVDKVHQNISSPIRKKKLYNKLDAFEFSTSEREKDFEAPTVDLEDVDDLEQETMQELEAAAPKDTCNLAYLIFLLMGFGILVPWITVTSAVDYFDMLYPPSYNTEFNLSVMYTTPLCLGLLVMIKVGKGYAFVPRILGGFTLFLLSFALIPVMGSYLEASTSFALTCALVAACGFADSVVEGSLYGLSGLFPPIYTQAVQGGTGIAAVLISFSRIGTKAALPNTREGIMISTQLYFGISAFSMVLCIVGMLVLVRLPITKYWMHTVISDTTKETISMETLHSSSVTLQDSKWREQLQVNYKQILRKVWPTALMVGVNFGLSLFLFPGLIAAIPSTRGNEWAWYSVILLTVFNMGDFIGKTLPLFGLKNVQERTLFIIGGLRVIFLPLLFLCVKPRVFNHDLIPVVFVIIFSVSGGMVGSKLMMIGPTKVEKREKEVTGTIMIFALCAGLAAGAALGWIIPYLL